MCHTCFFTTKRLSIFQPSLKLKVSSTIEPSACICEKKVVLSKKIYLPKFDCLNQLVCPQNTFIYDMSEMMYTWFTFCLILDIINTSGIKRRSLKKIWKHPKASLLKRPFCLSSRFQCTANIWCLRGYYIETNIESILMITLKNCSRYSEWLPFREKMWTIII